jgi:uncharacterized membrane protein YdcZ (DUF606 family)
MTLLELFLIGLAVTGLVGMGIVLGATIMWRLVHRTEPPPLPLWVSIAGGCSLLLIAVPLVAKGQWLGALIMVIGLGVGFAAQAWARIRLRGGSA